MKQTKQAFIVLPNMKSFLDPDGRRTIIRQYWHSLLFFGYLFLAFEFMLLEKYIVPQYWISCSLDLLIPFIPIFVVPYMLWFPIIAVVLILLCFSDRGDFIRTIMLIYFGMAVAMTIYMIFPHGQSLRPIITGDDYFSGLVRYNIYANDTNTNCCPSIHVLNQLALHIGLCKSKLFRDRRGWKITSLVITILVCSSTVLIKQHSIIDVAAALLLEIALYLLVFRLDWSNLFSQGLKSKLRQRELQKTENG
ncbi:MAG: phosphatidic acid phosphatase [Oscillospiraceae bacterium]|nr:phosphatidic acid phosphatase [Oscillospiraceae bacterium]